MRPGPWHGVPAYRCAPCGVPAVPTVPGRNRPENMCQATRAPGGASLHRCKGQERCPCTTTVRVPACCTCSGTRSCLSTWLLAYRLDDGPPPPSQHALLLQITHRQLTDQRAGACTCTFATREQILHHTTPPVAGAWRRRRRRARRISGSPVFCAFCSRHRVSTSPTLSPSDPQHPHHPRGRPCSCSPIAPDAGRRRGTDRYESAERAEHRPRPLRALA